MRTSNNPEIIHIILLMSVFLINLFIPTTVYAQTETPRFGHLTSEQGLSHDVIRCILQDEQGFMWFGTENGLNKYDGYTFTIYRHLHSDPNSLSSNTIYTLLEDHTGTLWIGTPMGLDSFTRDANGFKHYSAIHEEVDVLYEDSSGTLWIGTASAGLYEYNLDTEELIRHVNKPADPHSLNDDEIISIYEDSSGTLWAGTTDGGLNAFDRTTKDFTHYQHDPANPHSLSHNRVTTIWQDHSGVLWVGTGDNYEVDVGGLNAFDSTKQQFIHYRHHQQAPNSLSNNHVQTIYEDQSGILWIGTADGLNIFDRATNTFVSYHHDPLDPGSINRGGITAIYEDRSGMLWFGTDEGGIGKYIHSKEKFSHYQHDPLDNNSLAGTVVGAIFEDHRGVLWIGVPGDGLDSLDRTNGKVVHYKYDPENVNGLSNNNVRAIYEDHEGILWIGTNRGLDRFNYSTGQFTHYIHDPDEPGSLSPGAVKTILEDHTHSLWITTEGPGTINRFDRDTETFTIYTRNATNPNNFINTYGVRAIYEDRRGDLWFGTYDGLVYWHRDSKTFTRYEHDPDKSSSLSHDMVWSMYEDQAGMLWIATPNGLNRFDRTNELFDVYTVEDGLVNDDVTCILADDDENLWLGTGGGGLSRFDPRTESFRNYDMSDGLANNSIMLAACHRSESGEMFFGTLDGLIAFYPSTVKDNTYIPPIVLTAFRKFDQPVEFDIPLMDVEEINLSYTDNFFAFEFAALDYSEPAKNQYAYMLEGFDKDWVYCGSRRYASYTNLPPGKYTFHVKGSNNDKVWNESGHTVEIVIPPPFWDTWWFKSIIIAIIVSMAGVVIKNRLQRIAELRESEERLRALFENAPLCVFELDLTKSPPGIIRTNRQTELAYGWPIKELAATSLDKIFPSSTWLAMERVVSNLNVGQTTTIESVGLRRDGGEFPIRVSATGLSKDSVGVEQLAELKGAILSIEDITAEKERHSEEEAIAEERRRIAREIHDGLAQDLAGLRFKVGLWHKLVDNDPPQMHSELKNFQELLSKNIREVRRSIFALRPVTLDELGFYPALTEFTREFGEQNQLHINLQINGAPERLPAHLEAVLFRITQESLNNISKHAQATHVQVILDLTLPDKLVLSVQDDGVGFNPTDMAQFVRDGHLGLKQMSERVIRFGGSFDVNSQAGNGTEIHVVLPLKEILR